MAPHSSTFAWKIPWTEEPGRLQSMGSLESYTTEQLHFSLSCIGEGNGNPLQCSCLENPRDRGAWWTAVYGVAQSRTRLKWLSSSSIYILNVKVVPFCYVLWPQHYFELRMETLSIAYMHAFFFFLLRNRRNICIQHIHSFFFISLKQEVGFSLSVTSMMCL